MDETEMEAHISATAPACIRAFKLSPCRLANLIDDNFKTVPLSESDAAAKAFANLGLALSEATIESQDIDGVPLGFISTTLPFKASLILAPNLREVVGAVLGWPLVAVVPDRNFLYLWPARHTDFARR